jgi:hypothetical protein
MRKGMPAAASGMLGCFAFVMCSACTSASSAGSSGGRTGDASAEVSESSDASAETSDASADTPTDGGSGEGALGADAGNSGPVSCQSIHAVCATDAGGAGFTYHCVTSWSAAQQAASWCSYDPAIFPLPDCDSFDLVVDINIDVSYVYYYDRSTGALVGIGFNDFKGNLHCIAGTVVPVDITKCGWSPTSTSLCFSADAGAD